MFSPYSRQFCQHSGKHCLEDHRYQQEPTSTCVHSNPAAYRWSTSSNSRSHTFLAWTLRPDNCASPNFLTYLLTYLLILSYTPWVKKRATLYSCPYLCQILTDFHHSFTDVLSWKFGIKLSMKIPPMDKSIVSPFFDSQCSLQCHVFVLSHQQIHCHSFFYTYPWHMLQKAVPYIDFIFRCLFSGAGFSYHTHLNWKFLPHKINTAEVNEDDELVP